MTVKCDLDTGYGKHFKTIKQYLLDDLI